jgi:HSP20 family molecular chaperone IbpA
LGEGQVLGVVSLLIGVAEVIAATTAAREPEYLDEGPDLDENEDDFDAAVNYPLVDILEEEDELVVLIEVPGCYEDVKFGVREDILIFTNDEGREYHEVLLPRGYDLEEFSGALFNNGIITMKYHKMPDQLP